MQQIAVKMLVVLDHHEDVGKENEENINEAKESYISKKGDFGILRKSGITVVGK